MAVNKGFTLIELLVVIAIIALLSTFALISLQNASSHARDAERLSDVKNLSKALSLVASDDDSQEIICTLPSTPCGDGELTVNAKSPEFIASEFAKFTDPNYDSDNPEPCDTSSNSRCDYSFAFDGALPTANVGSTTILFWLEREAGELSQGLHGINSSGVFTDF